MVYICNMDFKVMEVLKVINFVCLLLLVNKNKYFDVFFDLLVFLMEKINLFFFLCYE